MTYEYRIITSQQFPGWNREIDKLGSQGWRVHSVSFSPGGNVLSILMEKVGHVAGLPRHTHEPAKSLEGVLYDVKANVMTIPQAVDEIHGLYTA